MHYTIVNSVICVNADPSTMALAMAALALDAPTNALLGLVVDSDVSTPVSSVKVSRTTVFHSTGAGPIPDGSLSDSPLGMMLTGYYVSTWGKELGTPIVADPVVVAP